MKKTNSDQHFRTTSLTLSVFLWAKEQPITGIHKLDGARKEFVFSKTPYLEELVDKFKFGARNDEDVLVDARLLEHARQTLLDRVHE